LFAFFPLPSSTTLCPYTTLFRSVVPNVVKMNWAREAALWTPNHPATVVHGDGDTIDGFADIIIVNYEILDRHVGWLGELGLRGRSEEHTSELQSHENLVCRLLLE